MLSEVTGCKDKIEDKIAKKSLTIIQNTERQILRGFYAFGIFRKTPFTRALSRGFPNLRFVHLKKHRSTFVVRRWRTGVRVLAGGSGRIPQVLLFRAW